MTTKRTSTRNFKPDACVRCGGDAYLDRSDEPEWRCLQCGRLVPDSIINGIQAPELVTADERRAA